MQATAAPMQPSDIGEMANCFKALGWMGKGLSQFERYLQEHKRNIRAALIARVDGAFAGYITVLWRSNYPPFAQASIPEVSDLNVLPQLRNRGVGTLLMDEAERLSAKRSLVVGIAVGLHKEYGAAQRLYVRRGYVPDGRGITSGGNQVAYGDRITADDDLVLWFTRTLRCEAKLST